MSITPYQYQLLTQTLASIRPNFHGFCTSWQTQLLRHDLNMEVPSNTKQLIIWEHQIFDFIQNCVMRLPQQSNLLYYLQKQKQVMVFLGTAEQDISVLLTTFIASLKRQLGRHFTHAAHNALQKALLIIKNMLLEQLFGKKNVVALKDFKQAQVHAT